MNSPESNLRARRTIVGFGLVEIMVAMLVSLFLLAGILQLFQSNSQTNKTNEALARIQENGRFALDFISQDLRTVGYTGCAGFNSGLEFNNNVDPNTALDGNAWFLLGGCPPDADGDFDCSDADGFSPENAITAWNDVNDLPIELTSIGLTMGSAEGDVVAGSDIVLIRGVRSCDGGTVVEDTPGANIKIADAESCGIFQNDIVLVADCNTADLFSVTSNPQPNGDKDNLAHGATQNISSHLSKTYGPDASVYKVYAGVVYIGNGSSGEPALIRRELVSNQLVNKELVEGIENLQLVFGEDTAANIDGLANRYVDADTVARMESVVSVRTNVLARSNRDFITLANQTYHFNGEDVQAADNRLRKSFSGTIMLRNRTN